MDISPTDVNLEATNKLLTLEGDLEQANKKINRLRCKLEKQIAYSEILRQENELLCCQINVNKVEVGVQTDVPAGSSECSQENNIAYSDGVSIADSLREAAEESMGKTGYVYDKKTGLYYDYNSGYYYDPENQLFYEPRSGVYLSYNNETREYAFHSRVDKEQLQKQYQDSLIQTGIQHLPPQTSLAKVQSDRLDITGCSSSNSEVRTCENVASPVSCSTEEGEVSDSDTLSPKADLEDSAEDSDVPLEHTPSHSRITEDLYPPCIRLIVRRSPCLDLGSLHIVTCSGGTIGKEVTLQHALYLQDDLVSKVHCEIKYNSDDRSFFIEDKATQSGTFLNNKRLSKIKRLSQLVRLKHEDVLRLGDTELLVHIHAGRETCSRCEPGQVQALITTMDAEEDRLATELYTMEHPGKTHETSRRHQNNKIKMKYGLKNSHYIEAAGIKSSSQVVKPHSRKQAYTDRANERRITVGSDHPAIYRPDHVASVDRPIAAENKGAKMLAKMGWKTGETLGKTQNAGGIQEPIRVDVRVNPTAGLGAQSNVTVSADYSAQETRNARRWVQAQERYRRLEEQDLRPTAHPTSAGDF